MGFLKSLFSTNKMNADPEQQALAKMFVDAVEGKIEPYELHIYLVKKFWPVSEVGDRITHALSVVKVSRPDLYPRAVTIGKDIFVNF